MLTSALPAPHTTGPGQAWLYGPARDYLFGYGLAYLLSVPLLLAATSRVGAGEGPLWVTTVLALTFSIPHYGATLLRVYENRSERRKYAIFTVWAALVLSALFIAGLYSALIGSLLLTAYVSWGIWHFSGQNYGIAVMYLRRRGVDVTPDLAWPLYASFVFSAILALLAIHVAGSQLSFAAGSRDPSGTFHVMQFGMPQPFQSIVDVVAVGGYLGSLGLAAIRLRGRLALSQLGPVALLVLTQALWFAVPALGTITGAWDSGRAGGYAFAAIWISTAHAIQYLWVTCYYAQRSGRCAGLPPYLTKCLLAGAAVTVPGLIFAPGLFGGITTHSAGIAVLVFSVVNLHHFLLDGAIWKLRDGPVARVLVRSQASTPGAELVRQGWPWLRAVVLGIGALVLVQQVYGAWLVRVVFTEETSLPARRAAAGNLHWLGLATPDVWLTFGHRAEEGGRRDWAIAAYRSALDMQAHAPPPWATNRLAWLLLREHRDDPRMLGEATHLARSLARTLGDSRPDGYQTLAAAYAAGGRWQNAIQAGERALRIAHKVGDDARVRFIEQKLADYRAHAVAAALYSTEH